MNIVLLIIPAIFCGIGLMVIVFTLRQWRKARRSELWPYVEGLITSTEVVEEASSGGRSTVYTPKIGYVYIVDGQAYPSTEFSVSGVISTSSSKRAERIIAQYPVGSSVRVYYDPERPTDAALKVGVGAALYFGLFFGLLFAGIGIFLLVRAMNV